MRSRCCRAAETYDPPDVSCPPLEDIVGWLVPPFLRNVVAAIFTDGDVVPSEVARNGFFELFQNLEPQVDYESYTFNCATTGFPGGDSGRRIHRSKEPFAVEGIIQQEIDRLRSDTADCADRGMDSWTFVSGFRNSFLLITTLDASISGSSASSDVFALWEAAQERRLTTLAIARLHRLLTELKQASEKDRCPTCQRLRSMPHSMQFSPTGSEVWTLRFTPACGRPKSKLNSKSSSPLSTRGSVTSLDKSARVVVSGRPGRTGVGGGPDPIFDFPARSESDRTGRRSTVMSLLHSLELKSRSLSSLRSTRSSRGGHSSDVNATTPTAVYTNGVDVHLSVYDAHSGAHEVDGTVMAEVWLRAMCRRAVKVLVDIWRRRIGETQILTADLRRLQRGIRQSPHYVAMEHLLPHLLKNIVHRHLSVNSTVTNVNGMFGDSRKSIVDIVVRRWVPLNPTRYFNVVNTGDRQIHFEAKPATGTTLRISTSHTCTRSPSMILRAATKGRGTTLYACHDDPDDPDGTVAGRSILTSMTGLPAPGKYQLSHKQLLHSLLPANIQSFRAFLAGAGQKCNSSTVDVAYKYPHSFRATSISEVACRDIRREVSCCLWIDLDAATSGSEPAYLHPFATVESTQEEQQKSEELGTAQRTHVSVADALLQGVEDVLRENFHWPPARAQRAAYATVWLTASGPDYKVRPPTTTPVVSREGEAASVERRQNLQHGQMPLLTPTDARRLRLLIDVRRTQQHTQTPLTSASSTCSFEPDVDVDVTRRSETGICDHHKEYEMDKGVDGNQEVGVVDPKKVEELAPTTFLNSDLSGEGRDECGERGSGDTGLIWESQTVKDANLWRKYVHVAWKSSFTVLFPLIQLYSIELHQTFLRHLQLKLRQRSFVAEAPSSVTRAHRGTSTTESLKMAPEKNAYPRPQPFDIAKMIDINGTRASRLPFSDKVQPLRTTTCPHHGPQQRPRAVCTCIPLQSGRYNLPFVYTTPTSTSTPTTSTTPTQNTAASTPPGEPATDSTCVQHSRQFRWFHQPNELASTTLSNRLWPKSRVDAFYACCHLSTATPRAARELWGAVVVPSCNVSETGLFRVETLRTPDGTPEPLGGTSNVHWWSAYVIRALPVPRKLPARLEPDGVYRPTHAIRAHILGERIPFAATSTTMAAKIVHTPGPWNHGSRKRKRPWFHSEVSTGSTTLNPLETQGLVGLRGLKTSTPKLNNIYRRHWTTEDSVGEYTGPGTAVKGTPGTGSLQKVILPECLVGALTIQLQEYIHIWDRQTSSKTGREGQNATLHVDTVEGGPFLKSFYRDAEAQTYIFYVRKRGIRCPMSQRIHGSNQCYFYYRKRDRFLQLRCSDEECKQRIRTPTIPDQVPQTSVQQVSESELARATPVARWPTWTDVGLDSIV